MTKRGKQHLRFSVRARGASLSGLVLAVLIATRPAVAAPVREIHYVMGTYFSIVIEDLPERQARSLMRRCFTEARRLEGVFSRYDASSELRRINAHAGGEPIDVSPDVADLLARSLELRIATAGAFDVTLGALAPLGDATDHGVHRVRATGDVRPGDGARFLNERQIAVAPGVQLDFDGIAKGYAVDRCADLLRAGNARHALLSLGESSQYAVGAPIDGAAWTVTVRDLDGDRALGTLALRDQGLSVSSALTPERHVAHIIDPSSGEPLHAPAAAVVVATSATEAEAWSKALLIHRGERYRQLHRRPAALYVTPAGIERLGDVAFTAYESPRTIDADAEPIR